MNILLVDDKKTILSTLSTFLGSQGCVVTTALNGLSGFEKTHQYDFDLFIIDHLMPVMDGIQLIKRLKQKEKLSSIPIIFMSTQDMQSISYLKESNIVDAVITKPIDYSQLASLINNYAPKNTLNLSL